MARSQCAARAAPTTIQDVPENTMSAIFGYLQPKDLSIISSVSKLRRRLIQGRDNQWKAAYTSRWGAPSLDPSEPDVSWQQEFFSRMWQLSSFSGKVCNRAGVPVAISTLASRHTGRTKQVLKQQSCSLQAAGHFHFTQKHPLICSSI